MLASYSTNMGHNFDFSNPKVLDKQRKSYKGQILEMIQILNNKNLKWPLIYKSSCYLNTLIIYLVNK